VIVVGTSGWQYRDWRGRFYPSGLAQSRWLAYFAEHFASVEVNNAFYRLPERDTFARWAGQTPEDFRIAVKMSRYLTHVKRLRDPAEPVARFLDRAAGLGGKLGPVLLQLPPTLKADVDILDDVLGQFPKEVRVAVEPRHPSWWTTPVREALQRYDAALCWADRHGRPVTPLWRTASFGYLRLHEGRATPRPRYGRQALASWVRRIAAEFDDGDEVYAYFNNDPGGAAIADATVFAAEAHRARRPVTRTPPSPPREAQWRA
jgi:uncharacterized protein YecE (DUF72 family)